MKTLSTFAAALTIAITSLTAPATARADEPATTPSVASDGDAAISAPAARRRGTGLAMMVGFTGGATMTADITGVGDGVDIDTDPGFSLRALGVIMLSDYFGIQGVFKYETWTAAGSVDVEEIGFGLGFRGLARFDGFSVGGGLDILYSMADADQLLQDTSGELELFPHAIATVDLIGGLEAEIDLGAETHPMAGVEGVIGYDGFTRFAGHVGLRYSFL